MVVPEAAVLPNSDGLAGSDVAGAAEVADAAGLLPKEKRPPEAGGAEVGVDVPAEVEVLPKRPPVDAAAGGACPAGF